MTARPQNFRGTRRDPTQLLWRRLLLVFGLVLVFFASRSVWHGYLQERASANLERESAAQLAELKQRQKQLNAHVADLTTDYGIEAAVRRQYDMGSAGEHLVVIVHQQPTTSASSTQPTFLQWLQRIWP